MATIGFVGVGAMGGGMVRNLFRAGHQVRLWSRTRARVEAFRSEGAEIADTPAAAARDAEVVISVLADDAPTESVALGADGLDWAGLGRVCAEDAGLAPLDASRKA